MNAKSAVELPSKPSDWALRELPARAATFLQAVGSHAAIRAAMQSAGYGPWDHEEGLSLLRSTCAYGTGGLDPAEDEPARDAAAAVAQWTGTHVGRLRAAVERLHPDALWVFAGFDGGASSSPLLGVAQLLEHLHSLEGRAHSAPLLETLSCRGFDQRERERLQDLLRTAQRALEPSRPRDEPTGRAPDEATLALHQWLNDWSTTARAVLKRKDWLIRLGVSRRRKRE